MRAATPLRTFAVGLSEIGGIYRCGDGSVFVPSVHMRKVMQEHETTANGAEGHAVSVYRSGGGSIVVDLRTASDETTGRQHRQVMGASPVDVSEEGLDNHRRLRLSGVFDQLLAAWFGAPMRILDEETGHSPRVPDPASRGLSGHAWGQSWTARGFAIHD